MTLIADTDEPSTAAAVDAVERLAVAIDWRAILAGAVAAAALFALMFAFGGGIGLSMASAEPYAGTSAVLAGIVVSLWTAVMSVLSFAAGGYVAGRMRMPVMFDEEERRFRDGMHGFLVWAVGGLIAAFMLASSAAMTASTTAAVVSRAVDGGATETLGQNVVAYYTDRLVRRDGEAASTAVSGVIATNTREEVSRILMSAATGGELPAADRIYLVSRISEQTGLAAPQAQQRVDETFAELEALRDKATTEARQAAETARKAAALLAFLTAAASLAALIAAAWAATLGGQHGDRNHGLVLFGRSKFW